MIEYGRLLLYHGGKLNWTGAMRIFRRGAAMVGVIFVVTGCTSGVVSDKRAPGIPGDKTFQIQVEVDQPSHFGDNRIWVTVDKAVWDSCQLYESWPECEVDGSS